MMGRKDRSKKPDPEMARTPPIEAQREEARDLANDAKVDFVAEKLVDLKQKVRRLPDVLATTGDPHLNAWIREKIRDHFGDDAL